MDFTIKQGCADFWAPMGREDYADAYDLRYFETDLVGRCSTTAAHSSRNRGTSPDGSRLSLPQFGSLALSGIYQRINS